MNCLPPREGARNLRFPEDFLLDHRVPYNAVRKQGRGGKGGKKKRSESTNASPFIGGRRHSKNEIKTFERMSDVWCTEKRKKKRCHKLTFIICANFESLSSCSIVRSVWQACVRTVLSESGDDAVPSLSEEAHLFVMPQLASSSLL